MEMQEALLYKKLSGSRVRCHTCQWQCTIGPGKLGVCRMYRNDDGVLHSLNYADASSVAADPIEKKPLFHFFPGSRVFSLGTWGCNFHCKHCQNWQISCADPSSLERRSRIISPQDAVAMAKRERCQGIAWTYNEPAIWFEYTLDSAKIAKKQGLYTVYVTNGFISSEALDAIGPYLDGYCVDVKGFTDHVYQHLATVTKWRGILDVAERAKHKWGMHVEVVTNVIPTMNDDDEQLEGIATWIRDKLGELTPWHVSRFYPQYQMLDIPATPVTTLERAHDIGKKVGLRFVYTGNVPGHDNEQTMCYSCGNLIIGRTGYHINIVGMKGSRCRFCGADLNMRTGGRSK
jgi:pyruvate formate lyase activating enzyme